MLILLLLNFNRKKANINIWELPSHFSGGETKVKEKKFFGNFLKKKMLTKKKKELPFKEKRSFFSHSYFKL